MAQPPTSYILSVYQGISTQPHLEALSINRHSQIHHFCSTSSPHANLLHRLRRGVSSSCRFVRPRPSAIAPPDSWMASVPSVRCSLHRMAPQGRCPKWMGPRNSLAKLVYNYVITTCAQISICTGTRVYRCRAVKSMFFFTLGCKPHN